MGKSRIEAFSDGVIAIVLTIMVLELKVPHGDTLDALRPLWGVMLSYLLSFVFIGIYWNNHHHLLHTVERVTAGVLWANLHLLFWLSLVSFVTGWMGENHFEAVPTAMYGFVQLMAGLAFAVLHRVILRSQPAGSALHRASEGAWKQPASLALYSAAFAVAWWVPTAAWLIYVTVAGMWLVPDRRIERALTAQD